MRVLVADEAVTHGEDDEGAGAVEVVLRELPAGLVLLDGLLDHPQDVQRVVLVPHRELQRLHDLARVQQDLQVLLNHLVLVRQLLDRLLVLRVLLLQLVLLKLKEHVVLQLTLVGSHHLCLRQLHRLVCPYLRVLREYVELLVHVVNANKSE